MLDLFVLRHAQAADFSHDPPLSERGQTQAAAFARWMKHHLALDAIYSSDLQRAAQTARPIVDVGRAVQTESRLREFHGWSRHYVPIDFQVEGEDPASGLEVWNLFYLRICTVLRETIQQHEGQRVLWVTHGGIFDVLMSVVLGYGRGQSMVTVTNHTGLSHYQFILDESIQGQLILHNQLDHLPPDLRTV